MKHAIIQSVIGCVKTASIIKFLYKCSPKFSYLQIPIHLPALFYDSYLLVRVRADMLPLRHEANNHLLHH